MCHWILFNTFENSVLGWPSSSSLWSVAAVRPGASVEASIENSCNMHFSKCVAGMKPQVQSPALKIRKTSACTAKLEKLRQEAHLIIVLKADLGNRVKPHCKTYKGKIQNMWGWATVLVAKARLWSSSPVNIQLGTWSHLHPHLPLHCCITALKWGQTGLRSLALWGLTCGPRSPIVPGALLNQRVSQEACRERQQQVRRRGEYPWSVCRRLAPDGNWIQRTWQRKAFLPLPHIPFSTTHTGTHL